MAKKILWDRDLLLEVGKLYIGLIGYHLVYNEGYDPSDLITRRKNRTDNIIPTMVGDQFPELMYLLEGMRGANNRWPNGIRNGKQVWAEFDGPTTVINSRAKACLDGSSKNELIPLLQRQTLIGPIQYLCEVIESGKSITKYDIMAVQEKLLLMTHGDGPGCYLFQDPDHLGDGYIGESENLSKRCKGRGFNMYLVRIWPTTNENAAKFIQDELLDFCSDRKKFFRKEGTRGAVRVLDETPIDEVIEGFMNRPALRGLFHTNIRTDKGQQTIIIPPLVQKILVEYKRKQLILPERPQLIMPDEVAFI